MVKANTLCKENKTKNFLIVLTFNKFNMQNNILHLCFIIFFVQKTKKKNFKTIKWLQYLNEKKKKYNIHVSFKLFNFM